jgi:ribosomal protein S18 acetylase RimI-like enzyme
MDNDLKIRLAIPQDNKSVAELLVQAMDELALKFVNSSRLSDALPVFELFFQKKNNQYSYDNTIVCEDKGEVIGSITGYDGGKYTTLRQPFLDHLIKNYSFNNKDLEDETSAGEFYLDTVSVLPSKQGLGIGTSLIKAFIDRARLLEHKRVGLLVDRENPEAMKLYERIGFELLDKKIFLGREYFHLIFELN